MHLGRMPGVKEMEQQDAGDLLSRVIQHLDEENKTVGKLFMAQQRYVTRCKTCKTETRGGKKSATC